SSRRRHTRSKRDWSSDVCSSDLRPLTRRPRRKPTADIPAEPVELTIERLGARGDGIGRIGAAPAYVAGALPGERVLVRPVAKREIGRASCREGVESWEGGGGRN